MSKSLWKHDAEDVIVWFAREIDKRAARLAAERLLRQAEGDPDAWADWSQAVDRMFAELHADHDRLVDRLAFDDPHDRTRHR